MIRPGRRTARTAPVLRFTPTAWAKLQFFCRYGETEIGGFGIAPPDDLLLVEEFVTVKQEATAVSISFDDAAVADFFDGQVDGGRLPPQFARLWLHTHPADSPTPSATDEETFARVFGSCDWAVMFILARGGQNYARLRFNVGPGGDLLVPVEVDFARPFAAADHDAWAVEYERNVRAVALDYGRFAYPADDPRLSGDGFDEEDADQLTVCEEIPAEDEALFEPWGTGIEVWS